MQAGSTLGIAIGTIACVAVGGIAYAVGNSAGQRSMLNQSSTELNGIQVSLAFNRLLDERRWGELLDAGCTAQAIEALNAAQDESMDLLSDLLKRPLDASTLKYVSDRDPKLIEQLRVFKSKHGHEWSEEGCKR